MLSVTATGPKPASGLRSPLAPILQAIRRASRSAHSPRGSRLPLCRTPVQAIPSGGGSAKIFHIRLDVPPLGRLYVRMSGPSREDVVRDAVVGQEGEARRACVV